MKYHFDEIKHIHYLDGKPLYGTSTITGVISKPLTWWASGKAVEFMGWLPTRLEDEKRLNSACNALSDIKEMSAEEYLGLLDKAYRNHKDSLDKSADRGIDLHAELEKFIKWQISRSPELPLLDERIKPFIEWSNLNVKKWILSEGYCYSEKLWTGGICDAVAELNDGKLAVIDFKSSKEAYFSHWCQTAGYILALEENGYFTKEGELVAKLDKPIDKIIIFPFGAEQLLPVVNSISINDCKTAFMACLTIHKIMPSDKFKKRGSKK